MKTPFTVSVLAVSLLTGCTVGPNYHRPAVQTPSTFRAPPPQLTPEAASLADLKWWEVFKDEKLQELIRASLVENYDLRDAVARVEAARLEERRLVAIEDRVDARLRLGSHAQLVAELEALVSEHPLREPLWGQLMLALYRAGRQADALRAYGRLRTLLGEELGIERLRAMIENHPDATPEGLRDAVMAEVNAWSESPSDDVSIIVARYGGAKS